MLSHSVRSSYWKSFRQKAHILLGDGYKAALGKIRQTEWEENDISGFIARKIDNLLTGELNFTPQYVNFQVVEQQPVNRPGKYGSRRHLIDIVIRCPQRGKTVAVFAFEAKRLRTNGFSIGKYTGKDGMGCFLHDEYTEKMPEAAMVGYFQDKDALYWEKQLCGKLTVPLRSISVVSTLRIEFKTEHTRNSGNKIDLYHIFLDCKPHL